MPEQQKQQSKSGADPVLFRPLNGSSSSSHTRIYRSVCLNSLPDNQLRELLVTNGVRAVVDMRSRAELHDPAKYKMPDGTTYRVMLVDSDTEPPKEIFNSSGSVNQTVDVTIYRVDFFTPKMISKMTDRGGVEDDFKKIWHLSMSDEKLNTKHFENLCKVAVEDRGMAGLYIDWLDPSVDPAGVRRVLRLFTDAGNLPTVIHCQYGKDRTGVVAMLLHLLIGEATRQWIVDDYHSTEEQIDSLLDGLRARCVSEGYNNELAGCPKRAMVATLQWLDERYGAVEQYLQTIGLTESEIHNIRSNIGTG